MKNALVAWRAPICLIAIIAAFASPGEAREVKEIDQAVLQHQKTLDQLKKQNEAFKKQNEDLKKQNEDLDKNLDDLAKKTAPVEAWIALGSVGVVAVLVWGGVTIARERGRPQQPQPDPKKIQEAVDLETKRVNEAVDARIKSITDLIQGLR
jgi:hypothetical protein